VSPTDDSIHDARLRELRELAQRLGHDFEDLALLDQALCHSSTGNLGRKSYERLEFFGDSILGFLVAEELYSYQPEIPEGELTDRRAQVVSRLPLALVADRLGLSSHLIGGRGLREQDRQSPRLRADLVEAVLAAIYLDGGLEAARDFVIRHALSDCEPPRGPVPRDPKSRLLHYAQVNAIGQPSYRLVRTWGPDHERNFEVAVVISAEEIAKGSGRTKQDAEKQAAARALERFQREAAGDGEPQ